MFVFFIKVMNYLEKLKLTKINSIVSEKNQEKRDDSYINLVSAIAFWFGMDEKEGSKKMETRLNLVVSLLNGLWIQFLAGDEENLRKEIFLSCLKGIEKL